MNDVAQNRYVDLLAKWIFIADQRWEIEDFLDRDGRDYDDEYVNEIIIELWIKHLNALKEEPWVNGQHYGDCTQVPMSCFRCIVDDYYKRAEEEIKRFVK
jgi:hypothetical protein